MLLRRVADDTSEKDDSPPPERDDKRDAFPKLMREESVLPRRLRRALNLPGLPLPSLAAGTVGSSQAFLRPMRGPTCAGDRSMKVDALLLPFLMSLAWQWPRMMMLPVAEAMVRSKWTPR